MQTKRKKDHQDPLIEIIIKVETVMEETEMEVVVDLEEIMIMVVVLLLHIGLLLELIINQELYKLLGEL